MRRPLLIRTITGPSMLPGLKPGSLVVGWAYFRPQRLRVGQVVMFNHEQLEKIKRITKLEPGRMQVAGDNALQSTDSRQFGWLDTVAVKAIVIWPR